MRIKATNLFAWESLDYEIEKGLTKVNAWNFDDNNREGAGKSSLPNILSWIVYGELMDWRLRTYNNGLQDGQLVLAADQLGRQQVTFFNGTFIQTFEIEELCQRLYGRE